MLHLAHCWHIWRHCLYWVTEFNIDVSIKGFQEYGTVWNYPSFGKYNLIPFSSIYCLKSTIIWISFPIRKIDVFLLLFLPLDFKCRHKSFLPNNKKITSKGLLHLKMSVPSREQCAQHIQKFASNVYCWNMICNRRIHSQTNLYLRALLLPPH